MTDHLVYTGDHLLYGVGSLHLSNVCPGLGYVFSGIATDSCHAYNPNSDSWAVKTSTPTSYRVGVFAFAVSTKFYCVGGQQPIFPTTKNEEYDQVGDSWATKTVYPISVTHGSASSIGSYGYCFAGTSDLDDVNRYDQVGDSWLARTAHPSPHYAATSQPLEGYGYTFGGFNAGSELSINYRFDPVGNSWAARTSLSETTAIPGSFSKDDKAYVIGGQTTTIGNTDHNREYDSVANTWVNKAVRGIANFGLLGYTLTNDGYAMGGGGASPITDNEKYDISGDSWVSKAVMLTARSEGGVGTV